MSKPKLSVRIRKGEDLLKAAKNELKKLLDTEEMTMYEDVWGEMQVVYHANKSARVRMRVEGKLTATNHDNKQSSETRIRNNNSNHTYNIKI